MAEPTQEQVKEFWEWCGFEYKHEEIVDASASKVFITTSYFNGVETQIPDIDLNNLFKWAVPKLKDIEITKSRHSPEWNVAVSTGEPILGEFAQSDNKDPALALFWAIWEVIHNE